MHELLKEQTFKDFLFKKQEEKKFPRYLEEKGKGSPLHPATPQKDSL